MQANYARPRPVMEFLIKGELRVRPASAKRIARFLTRNETVSHVEERGKGLIFFVSSDPGISLLVSSQFRRDLISFRPVEIRKVESI